MPITENVLRGLWPHGDDKVPGLIAATVAAAPIVFNRYGLAGEEEIIQAMAQFSHECGAGLEMVENINYSAERACVVWPSRFRSAMDCYAKVNSWHGDPQFKFKLIDHVYGGRMDNAPYPSHDGSTYIGRGFSQTTGKAGYRRVGELIKIDLLKQPDLVCGAERALECGVADFVLCGCLPFAKDGDIENVTRKLNGGYIGLAERRVWLRRWRDAFDGTAVPAQRTRGDLATVEAVKDLQRALIAEGFDPGAVDGALGPKTIKAFQISRGIAPFDGIAGEKTSPPLKAAIENLKHFPLSA